MSWSDYWNAAHTPRSTEPGDDARANGRATVGTGAVSAPAGGSRVAPAPDPALHADLTLALIGIAIAGLPKPQKLPRVVCERAFIDEWVAYDLNYGSGDGDPRGYGATKAEAIEDLLIDTEERYGDDKRERLCHENDLCRQHDDEDESYEPEDY